MCLNIFKISIFLNEIFQNTLKNTRMCFNFFDKFYNHRKPFKIDFYVKVSIHYAYVSIQSLAVAQVGMKPSNVLIQVCMYRYLLMSIDTDPRSIDTEIGSSLRLAETLVCIDTKVHVSIQIA